MNLKKFIVRIITLSIILIIIAFVVFTIVPKLYLPIFPFLVLFFILTTIGIHIVLFRAGGQRPARFSALFMGSITSKLFLYLIFILIYILADKENAVVFLITFFILYLCYTIFETITLLNDFKNNPVSKKTE